MSEQESNRKLTSINYKQLFAQINSCEGMKCYKLMVAHQTIEGIFAGNYRQLKESIQFIHNPAKSLSFFIVGNRKELHMLYTDVLRLLHNYLASAFSLVNHTRVLLKSDAVKQELLEQYNAKVMAEFTNDPFAGFVQDLRNYILHVGLSFTKIQESSAKGSSWGFDILIDIDELKKWDGWHSRGKEYI